MDGYWFLLCLTSLPVCLLFLIPPLNERSPSDDLVPSGDRGTGADVFIWLGRWSGVPAPVPVPHHASLSAGRQTNRPPEAAAY